MKRTPGRTVAPVVQRVRLEYAKRGRLRFSSHRDFQRALERAIRRAGIPIAFSAGFSPHPRISYANSAPTGTASEAEYVELAVTETIDPAWVRSRLDSALPEGFDVLRVVEATPPDLAARLQASLWRMVLPGVTPSEATSAAARFLDEEAVEVSRMTKSGMRTFDARGPVVSLAVEPGESEKGCAILHVVVRHVTPSVRPDDVLSALRNVADLVPPAPARVTRLAQGPFDPRTGSVGDPFAPDIVAESASQH
ncbi:MAG: TIGR03936 family radical SAM-associated protein [Actinomycetota bacterium]